VLKDYLLGFDGEVMRCVFQGSGVRGVWTAVKAPICGQGCVCSHRENTHCSCAIFFLCCTGCCQISIIQPSLLLVECVLANPSPSPQPLVCFLACPVFAFQYPFSDLFCPPTRRRKFGQPSHRALCCTHGTAQVCRESSNSGFCDGQCVPTEQRVGLSVPAY